MLQRSMAQTDDEEKKVDSVTTAVAAKVETANQNIQVVVRERQKVEASILAKNGERLTVNKAVKNYMKAASAMTNAAHDKEIEAAHKAKKLDVGEMFKTLSGGGKLDIGRWRAFTKDYNLKDEDIDNMFNVRSC